MDNRIYIAARVAVLVLSVALVVCISVATFNGVSFTDDAFYMHLQFWVCVAFMGILFVELWAQRANRWRYFWRNITFLLIAIPYLNIIAAAGIDVHPAVMEYLKYIPLLRGAYVMVIVINYVSTSRIMGIFMSYLSIIVLMLYFASMLFYVRESGVNPAITGYGTSVWWCALEFTTIGAPINPVTPTGKVLAAVLSAMGVIMFPLFTVYLSETLRKYLARVRVKS
jgi:hypothetical protein